MTTTCNEIYMTGRHSLTPFLSGIRAGFLFMLLGFSVAIFGKETLIQYDGRCSYFFVDPHLGVDPIASEGFLINSNMYSTRYFSESTSFLLEHRLRGNNHVLLHPGYTLIDSFSTIPDRLFPEQVLPFDNYLYAGFRSSGDFGVFQAGYSNELFPYAKPLFTPYLPPLRAMKPEMLNAASGSYNYEGDLFSVDVKSTYFISNYSYTPGNPIAGIDQYSNAVDADLWSDLKGEFFILDDFTLGGGWLLKNDLDSIDGYNFNRFWGGISGEHLLFKRKLTFGWEARERFLQSGAATLNNYAVGPATEVWSKLLWRISSDFFIKGGARMEFGPELSKLFWQAQIRKLYANNSSFDFEYFATAGVLFPRHGIGSAGKVYITPHFGVAPRTEVFFSRIAQESAFRYYRTDLNLECFVPVRNRLEIYAGGGYRHYQRHPLFATRGAISAGVRSW